MFLCDVSCVNVNAELMFAHGSVLKPGRLVKRLTRSLSDSEPVAAVALSCIMWRWASNVRLIRGKASTFFFLIRKP